MATAEYANVLAYVEAVEKRIVVVEEQLAASKARSTNLADAWG